MSTRAREPVRHARWLSMIVPFWKLDRRTHLVQLPPLRECDDALVYTQNELSESARRQAEAQDIRRALAIAASN